MNGNSKLFETNLWNKENNLIRRMKMSESNNVLRLPAEQMYANEIEALISADKGSAN